MCAALSRKAIGGTVAARPVPLWVIGWQACHETCSTPHAEGASWCPVNVRLNARPTGEVVSAAHLVPQKMWDLFGLYRTVSDRRVDKRP